MNRFDDVRLEWNGKEYVIPSDSVMGAICRIEDVITLIELIRFKSRGANPQGKIAAAYGAVLRYAGANVKDEDVYFGMFKGSGPEAIATTQRSIEMLLEMMLPPDSVFEGKPKGAPAGNGSPAATHPSRRRSKRPSAGAAG